MPRFRITGTTAGATDHQGRGGVGLSGAADGVLQGLSATSVSPAVRSEASPQDSGSGDAQWLSGEVEEVEDGEWTALCRPHAVSKAGSACRCLTRYDSALVQPERGDVLSRSEHHLEPKRLLFVLQGVFFSVC